MESFGGNLTCDDFTDVSFDVSRYSDREGVVVLDLPIRKVKQNETLTKLWNADRKVYKANAIAFFKNHQWKMAFYSHLIPDCSEGEEWNEEDWKELAEVSSVLQIKNVYFCDNPMRLRIGFMLELDNQAKSGAWSPSDFVSSPAFPDVKWRVQTIENTKEGEYLEISGSWRDFSNGSMHVFYDHMKKWDTDERTPEAKKIFLENEWYLTVNPHTSKRPPQKLSIVEVIPSDKPQEFRFGYGLYTERNKTL